MNKELFIDTSNHIETNVNEFKWIDYDAGQLDVENPPVALPCCLIDIVYPQCEDTDNHQQQIVNADIVLRVAFAPTGATNSAAPVDIRAAALNIFDTVEKLHKFMQSWTDNYKISPCSRNGGQREKRRDGLPVYRITYRTTFIDSPQ